MMTSPCRLPPSLLAAGMPLEFRLTMDFMPTGYEHLHQTVKFRSINSVPPTICPAVEDELSLVSPA